MAEISFEDWMRKGKYLPEPLRDFHDQKDTFKAIHEIINANDVTKKISWIDAQIYVIDVFLWFMALRGYTLQRSRAGHDFSDLRGAVIDQKEKRHTSFYAALRAATTEQKD